MQTPTIDTMGVNFKIGQCIIFANVDATRTYYETLPRISENCTCEDCAYFESNVINRDIGIFTILRDMGVDLTRQPNVNPDGVCSVGETAKYKRSYMGYYQFFGQLNGTLETVDFYETTDDSTIRYEIKTGINDKLTVDFYLECEKLKRDM